MLRVLEEILKDVETATFEDTVFRLRRVHTKCILKEDEAHFLGSNTLALAQHIQHKAYRVQRDLLAVYGLETEQS